MSSLVPEMMKRRKKGIQLRQNYLHLSTKRKNKKKTEDILKSSQNPRSAKIVKSALRKKKQRKQINFNKKLLNMRVYLSVLKDNSV